MPVPLAVPEAAIVRAVNVQRHAHGLPGLRATLGLSRVAERHSRDQMRRNRMGHDSSDGSSLAGRVARTGRVGPAGEVLAFTPRGARSRARVVVRMWMRSPLHRRQLLTRRYRVIGVGRVPGMMGARRGAIVTAVFATR